MEPSIRTTFREFQELFLGAIENSMLEQFGDELQELVKKQHLQVLLKIVHLVQWSQLD